MTHAMSTPYNKYKQQGILTANPVELIVMLYDGCIKNLKIAQMAINDKDYDKCNSSLIKAQDIIMELLNSLDMRYPISKDLMDLYDFALLEIVQINVNKDAPRVDGIIGILSSLRQAWSEISKEARGTMSLAEV